MTDDRRPYVDPPPPTIAEAEAIRIAASSLGVESGAVRDVVLLVTFDTSTGGQLLVWRLQVGHDTGEYVDAALVDVDAVTGKVTIIGRG